MKSESPSGVVTLLAVIVATNLALFLFQQILWLVVPILLGVVTYYCVRPLVDALVARGIPHKIAAAGVWLLLQLVAIAVVIATVLFVTAKAGSLQSEFERYLQGGQRLIGQTAASLEKVAPMFARMNLAQQVDEETQRFSEHFAAKSLLPFALFLMKWLPSLLLIPFLSYFLLIDGTRFKKYVIASVPNAFFEKSLLLFSRLDSSLKNYFHGLLLLTLLDTISLAIGLGVLGMRNALWLGLAAAVLAWIPYVGSAVGCVGIMLIAATDFPGNPGMAYAALGVCLVVRLLDDFIYMPNTVGRKLRIHPLLSVLLLFLGTMVAGATGLVLALPVFGAVAVIGETVSQIVTDRRLMARYRAARQRAAVAP